ncbi:hypothetical protein GCM10009839_33170 [Catenulispora yoronensis]|uniref:Histidine kinase/HSP90-like ATPase domain-containing protein n=1 Tax=Catenulispora yoronensis TaxID=450799 RepID=A0ABP5FNR1_9ACTN
MDRQRGHDTKHAVLHLPASSDAPGKARDFLADFASTHDGAAEACLPQGSLVVSELVANAVMHAGTPVSVGLTVRPDALEVAVGDLDPAPPKLLPPDPHRIGGLGLHMVNQLAEAWGVRTIGQRGKTVWCRLRPQAQLG